MLAHWCSNDNFGDKLTPYLIEKITGKKPTFVNIKDSRHKFLVTGSILGTMYASNATIWGCGIAFKDEKIYKSNGIIATRGPISFKRVIDCNAGTPKAYGDPAVLLPDYYYPTYSKIHKIGIMPSWVDMQIVNEHYPNIFKINVFDDIEKVIKDILSCDVVICSCLHGLITCTAYGIPTKWVKFSDKVIGDDTKFLDFLSSINYVYDFVNLKSKINEENLAKMATIHPIKNLDKKKLFEHCPF